MGLRTEMPRLVLNEAYAQINNDANDPDIAALMKASRYDLNFFVELHIRSISQRPALTRVTKVRRI